MLQYLCLLVSRAGLGGVHIGLPDVAHGQVTEEVDHELQELLLQHQVHVLQSLLRLGSVLLRSQAMTRDVYIGLILGQRAMYTF